MCLRNMDATASHMGGQATSKNCQNVNKSILDIFEGLGTGDGVRRNECCVALVQHLAESTNQETDEPVPPDVIYCLKRLIRGLGAIHKQNLQKGYFTALVVVLDSFPSISCTMFMELVEQELACSKNSSKGEEGEAMMGQVLAYGATIRGGLFARSSTEHQRQILLTLINCGKKKSYLPFASSTFFLDLIHCSEDSLVEVIWPALKDEVAKPWEDQTFDTLLILLSVVGRFSNVVKSKTIQKWLGFPLLSPQSMQNFAFKLVSSSINFLSLKHPIYDEFCRCLCVPNNQTLLETFWTVNVDGLLAAPNKNKDLAVLHLLSILLKSVSNKEQIVCLVTPRILELIGRTSRVPPNEKKKYQDAYFKAKEVMSSLTNALVADDVSDKVILSMLRKILFDSGNLQYEKKTGTHLTILLESKLSKKGVQKLAKQFKEVLDGVPLSNGQIWINSDRKFAAQQLVRLIGHQAFNDDTEWKVEQLLYLLQRGVLKQDCPSSIGVELAGHVRQCFFRALDQKFSNLETMIGVLNPLVKHIDQIISNTDRCRSSKIMWRSFSNDVIVSWHKMMKTTRHLEKKSESNGNKESVEKIFRILFLFMGLHLISDPDMAKGALQELHSCYERVKGGKQDSKHSEEPQWVEVTVDLFLSLLSHDSHLLRTVVGAVFPHLSKHLSVSAFCQILEVLDPDQNENPLTSDKDFNDGSDEDSNTSSNEEELHDIVKGKFLNGQLKKSPSSKANQESSDENSVESEESSEDEDIEDSKEKEDDDFDEDEEEDFDEEGEEEFDEDETVNDKLRQEVRLALGNAASLTDTESVDLDEIDEEEGNRMDEALARAFKVLRQSRRRKKSKKQLKTDEAVTHFRNRVLDLVELYFSREPSMDICLECIAPLLSLLAFCMKDVHQKPLEIKTKSVLRKLANVKKFSSIEGIDEEIIAKHIMLLTEKGVRSASTFLGLSDIISECSTFLVRCSENIRSHSSKPSKVSPVAKVYETFLIDYFTKRDTLLPVSMFGSVLILHWSGCWNLAPVLVQHAFNPDVRPYRRGQAINLLSVFLRNNRLLEDTKDKEKQALKKIVASIINHTIGLINNLNKDQEHKIQPSRFLIKALRLIHQIFTRPQTKPVDTSSLSTTLATFCQNSSGVSVELRKVLGSLSKHLNLDMSTVPKAKSSRKAENMELSNGSNGNVSTPCSKESGTSKTKLNGPVGTEGNQNAKPLKNHKELQNIRNAKKMQRLALMAEGLDSVAFSAIGDEVLNGLEPDFDRDGHGEDRLHRTVDHQPNGFLKSGKLPAKRKSKHSSLDNSSLARKKKKSNTEG